MWLLGFYLVPHELDYTVEKCNKVIQNSHVCATTGLQALDRLIRKLESFKTISVVVR